MEVLNFYIGNKNYSSWSFRPWIALTARQYSLSKKCWCPFDDAGVPRIPEIS